MSLLNKIDQKAADRAGDMLSALTRLLGRNGEAMMAFDGLEGTAIGYQRSDKTAHQYKWVEMIERPGYYKWEEVTNG